MICLLAVFIFFVCKSAPFSAAEAYSFDGEIESIEESIDEDTRSGLSELGADGVDDIISGGVDGKELWSYLLDKLSLYSRGPLSALILLTAAMLLASVAEAYTFSLRYTDTKDIMGVAVSLYVASAVIGPVTELAGAAVTVIRGASTVMTVYLPVMAGILAFSGHAISSSGYYVAVMTASQLLSKLASSVLTPLLNIFLSLSISAGICSRIHLGGLIETAAKLFKYGITFAMSVFIAVIGLNGALTGAADSVASKAARFSLSSFVPLIGSSIAEAYGALQSSIGILRSGIGVFVILSVFVAFAPLLLRTALWSAALSAAKMVGEALSVSSAGGVFNALTQFLSALRALLLAVMTVFIISSAIMLSLGGGS